MPIKMRVLVSSGKGKMSTIATSIRNEFDLGPNAVDKIPPAYSCDKERIVILAVSCGDKPKDDIIKFCSTFEKSRADNVALLIDGTENAANKLKEKLISAGTNVIDEVFFTKCSLPFLKNVKPEEKEKILAWAHRATEQMK